MRNPDHTTSRPGIALALVIAALGLAGVASLLAMPLEEMLPDGIDVPRIALVVNPAILVLAAAFIGWFAAQRVGLAAPVLENSLSGGDWKRPFLAALKPALIVSIVGAAALLAYGAATAAVFAEQGAGMEQPLVSRLLYGGISEEVVLRWGLMSMVAAIAFRFGAATGAAQWIGNAVAALIFGLGHLPLLFGIMPEAPADLVALVVSANAALGLLFGWLFMRKGLEAAMIAHALTHLFAVAAGTILLANS